METSMSKMKCCIKCKEEKPLGEFYRAKKSKDGRQSYCKVCDQSSVRKWQINNPDKLKMFVKRWKYEKQGVYGIFSGSTCLYIGQSIQLNNRITKHKTYLKHPELECTQQSLYTSLRKYSNVVYRVVKECSPEALLRLESYYIDEYKPLYNTHKT